MGTTLAFRGTLASFDVPLHGRLVDRAFEPLSQILLPESPCRLGPQEPALWRRVGQISSMMLHARVPVVNMLCGLAFLATECNESRCNMRHAI